MIVYRMTHPRSFTSLHRAGRSARPKLRSLKRNKKDVAPRTRRHVRAVRHGFGFHSRDVREKTRKFGRWLPPLLLQPRIFSHQISSIGAVARSPRFGRSPQYLATDCGGPPSLDGPRQPSRITATSTRPCQASPRQHRPVAMSVSGGRPEVVDCRSNRRD